MKKKNERFLAFVADIKREVFHHPVMKHPFWNRFRAGCLTMEQLRALALHYYHHVRRTRLYAAAVLSRTPEEEIQAALASVLWDEYGAGDRGQSHPEQFRRLLRALGLTEAEWDRTPPLPELEMYADVHFQLSTAYDIWTGLGVVGVAMELPIPTLYRYLIEGFTKSSLTETDLEFFVKHGPMDLRHATLFLETLFPHLACDTDRRSLLRLGALRSLDARAILMDGLYRVVWKEPDHAI